jgi:hypothetical protein
MLALGCAGRPVGSSQLSRDSESSDNRGETSEWDGGACVATLRSGTDGCEVRVGTKSGDSLYSEIKDSKHRLACNKSIVVCRSSRTCLCLEHNPSQ